MQSQMSQIQIHQFTFEQLPHHWLYQALKLRSDIFVVEQACVYPDLDNKDLVEGNLHILALCRESNEVVGYARCLPPNTSYPGSSIGRVAVSEAQRGTGLGREIVLHALQTCRQQWPGTPVEIGAQVYLQPFYASLGFEPFSDPYDEDGIMHIDMRNCA